MSESLLESTPGGGWTTEDLDRIPVSNIRYELTDGALTVSPSPSNLHQALAVRLASRLDALAPPDLAVAVAVQIRFAPRLTRIPDLMLVRSDQPGRHWFAPAEVVVAIEIESPGNHIEDRTTKPAFYAQFGIGSYWRIEPEPLRVSTYRLEAAYEETYAGDRLRVSEPFDVDIELVELLPRWARRE